MHVPPGGSSEGSGQVFVDIHCSITIMVLSEFRNLGQMNHELLEPYMDLIRRLAEDPHQTIRDQANYIIDMMEGRDLRTLASQIEEQNKLIKAATLYPVYQLSFSMWSQYC